MLIEILLVGAVAGFVQGLSGFAFALVATSLWAWMMEPQRIVPLVVMGSLLGQSVAILSVRSEISLVRIRPFVIGGLVGVPIGASFLHALNADTFRPLFGLGLIVFCTVMLRISKLPTIQAGLAADGCVGLVSGTLSGACGMGGPPMTIWCAMRGWSARAQRATFQTSFIVTQTLGLGIYAWQGMIDMPMLQALAALAPVIICFSWLGSRVGKKLRDAQFRKIVFVLLLISGFVLVMPAAKLAGLAVWRSIG